MGKDKSEIVPTGYDLSRQWFDWCFENPDKVKPNHIALYFFIIEHCNRMGWKRKFGLPTTMAKDAIGIRSYHTYINTLNDLIDWGFITLIEKSTNQYSSNIVALAYFDKAHDKAHDKAYDKALAKHMSKHCQSTCQSISSIDKHITIEPLTNNIVENDGNKINGLDKTDSAHMTEHMASDWRNSFEVYKQELKEAYKELINDEAYIKQRQGYHNNLDIPKSLEKACVDYWATEEGWAKKKKSKSKTIDWRSTFNNALSLTCNQVRK